MRTFEAEPALTTHDYGALRGEPRPHPDLLWLQRWTHVVTCIARHEELLRRQGASRERLASTTMVLEQARESHTRESRASALERLRRLARHEGGLAQTALDMAESLVDEAA